ncbi:hypothetical protein LINPERHAP2_LOCUS37889 [Linum perenne]
MASSWVKSLQCKSRAFDDVFIPAPRNLSCRKTAQNINDVVDSASAAANRKKPKTHRSHKTGPKSNPKPDPFPTRTALTGYRHNKPETAAMFPALKELPEGHPSRNVVEIIFHTSWSNKSFSGRVEMIFKVQNGTRTATRFEEYREGVKSRAGFCDGGAWEENSRCVADGNEMMRFYCLGPSTGDAWVFPGGGKCGGSGICTYSGSGVAHDSGGGGKGRRAMLVCRVIAGRVSKKRVGLDSVGFDSVSGDNGELLVLDSRAVLPCFLIIYKL